MPWVGHFQIRNRGTIGGSLAHADPAAELPAVAACLDARVTVRGPAGTRTLTADQLYWTYLTTTLAPTEILTEVWFPAAPSRTGHAWLEFARRHGDYALVVVAAVVMLEEDSVAEARLALTGGGARPVRARGVARRLARRRLGGAAVRPGLLLAAPAHGARGTGLGRAAADGAPHHPVREGLVAMHGFQCGSGTPGVLLSAVELLRDTPHPDDATIRRGLAGNL